MMPDGVVVEGTMTLVNAQGSWEGTYSRRITDVPDGDDTVDLEFDLLGVGAFEGLRYTGSGHGDHDVVSVTGQIVPFP